MSKLLKVIAVKRDVASDGAEYVSVKFGDASNPFAEHKTRNYRQSGSKEAGFKWTIDPTAIKEGMTVEGSIKSFETEPYAILDDAGMPVRQAETFSTAILGHEEGKIASVLKSMGKTL